MVGRRGGPLEEQAPDADGPVTTVPAGESGPFLQEATVRVNHLQVMGTRAGPDRTYRREPCTHIATRSRFISFVTFWGVLLRQYRVNS